MSFSQKFYDKINVFKCPKIVYGLHTIAKVGEIAKSFGNKILVISDPGIRKANILKYIEEPLNEAYIDYEIFSQISPEPTIEDAETVADKVRSYNYNAIIGYGGGSSLDMAKIASIAATNREKISDFIGNEKVKRKGLPLILIPTTAGTGSEVTRFIVLSVKDIKKVIISLNAMADIAVIDPYLTVSMPRNITAGTGFDALSHAIESNMSTLSTILSESVGLNAIKYILEYIERAYYNGNDIEARSMMAVASTMAGISLNIGGVVLGHSIAYTIATKKYKHHGTLCAIALPYTMIYNMPVCKDLYLKIAKYIDLEYPSTYDAKDISKLLIRKIAELIAELNIPISLRDLGFSKSDIPTLVDKLINYYPRPNNPREFNRDDLIKLYELMYEGIL